MVLVLGPVGPDLGPDLDLDLSLTTLCLVTSESTITKASLYPFFTKKNKKTKKVWNLAATSPATPPFLQPVSFTILTNTNVSNVLVVVMECFVSCYWIDLPKRIVNDTATDPLSISVASRCLHQRELHRIRHLQ